MTDADPPRLRRRAPVEKYVYFIRCEQFVKIGFSSNPRYRAHSFSTSNPFECCLIGLVRGGRDLERQLHELFSAFKHRDEWFRLTPDIEAQIRELCGDWSDLDRRPGMGWAIVAREMDQKLHGLI